MAQVTGAERFNLKMIIHKDDEKNRIETYGVASEDCSKLFILGWSVEPGEIITYTQISQDTAERIEREGGDSISSPSYPYTTRPGHQVAVQHFRSARYIVLSRKAANVGMP